MKYTLELVNNGWILTRHPTYEGEEVEVYIFEENEFGQFSEHEAARNLIHHLFEDLIRNKYKGGLEININEKGLKEE